MIRILRQSEFKDYIAVDLINELGNVISTPIYLRKNKPQKLWAFDAEQRKYLKTMVTFDGEKLLCNGDLYWESPISELIDTCYAPGYKDKLIFKEI